MCIKLLIIKLVRESERVSLKPFRGLSHSVGPKVAHQIELYFLLVQI